MYVKTSLQFQSEFKNIILDEKKLGENFLSM